MRKGEWLIVEIPKIWEGKTLHDIFVYEWEVAKKIIHHFRQDGNVLVNGSPANWNIPLIYREKLGIKLIKKEENEITPWYFDVPILYEDDHMIVFNKPPFMNTHPNDLKHDTKTLVNAAMFYLQTKGESEHIQQIHRLDRDTSGAIVFAKHPLAGAILDRMLEKRQIKRTYIALVHGLCKMKKGTIKQPIGRDRHHATRRRVSNTGQDAVTHFQVLKMDYKNQLSYVKCWLDTGRTHQIRVHLSHIGHPLAGDTLYGGKPIVNRQALHAVKLEIPHPFTKETIVCHAPFLDQPPIFKDVDIYSI